MAHLIRSERGTPLCNKLQKSGCFAEASACLLQLRLRSSEM
ncbi:MAG: hypothetical protein WBK97_00880 [Bacteroidales bacterium]